MKFRNRQTGAVYEPIPAVAAMMASDPNLEQVAERAAKPRQAAKATQKRVSKATTAKGR